MWRNNLARRFILLYCFMTRFFEAQIEAERGREGRNLGDLFLTAEARANRGSHWHCVFQLGREVS